MMSKMILLRFKDNDITITKNDLVKQLGRTASWKSPGPDGIHGYWYKNFYSLHDTLYKQLEECLQMQQIPEWMTIGRTVRRMQAKETR